MKLKFLSITLSLIICLSFSTSKTSAEIKAPFSDTACCSPDSLKVVSTNYPVFCVSWRISADSSCKTPYGFQIEWRTFPSIGPWIGKTVIYTGGTKINFCDSVSVCSGYQWRVRTICDSTSTTFSDWVYGNKFAMQNCGGGDFEGSDNKKSSPYSKNNMTTYPTQILKQKEN